MKKGRVILYAEKGNVKLLQGRLEKVGMSVSVQQPDPGEGITDPTLIIPVQNYIYGIPGIARYISEHERELGLCR